MISKPNLLHVVYLLKNSLFKQNWSRARNKEYVQAHVQKNTAHSSRQFCYKFLSNSAKLHTQHINLIY